MLDRLFARWQGVLLALVAIIATISLAVSGKLGLYINPRYFVFTVIMAVIGAALVIAAFAIVPGTEADDDPLDHGYGPDETQRVGPRRPWRLVPAALVIIAAVIALLVLPPQTLTSAAAAQRSVNSSAGSLRQQNAPALVGGSTAAFSVKDWAVLLAQNSDATFFQGKKVDVIGFISASPTDPANVFYVTRFVVTCCAVDAQPVGVPISAPGWQSKFSADDWVEASGQFTSNADSSSAQKLLLTPTKLEKTKKPDQPYVF